MSTLTIPSATRLPSSRDHAISWVQPLTLTITSHDSDSSFDPSCVHVQSEPKQASGSSAGYEDVDADSLTSRPRGHHLAWSILLRIIQSPSLPRFPKISVPLSTLSFSRSSRPKPFPSSSSSSPSPSTPTALSSSSFSSSSDRLQETTQDKPAPTSHFLCAPSPHCTVDIAYDSTNNDTSETKSHRARAYSFSSTFASTPSSFFSHPAILASMSRPSWDPLPLIVPTTSTTSSSASASPSTATAPKSILSNLNPISIEDARLLDPTYLSSIPIPTQNVSHGLCIGGSNTVGGAARYSHVMPYIDPQGTLHDPDYRPFPLIRQTKKSMMPSPFAVRKPYWETDYEGGEDNDGRFGVDGGGGAGEEEGEDGYDSDGSTPSTPTSITPFIYYFLETHPLKPRTPARDRNIGPSSSSSSRIFGSSYDSHSFDDRNPGRGKRCKGPGSQLKLGTAYMYATITTGLGGKGSTSQGGYGAQTATTPTVTGSPLPQYTSMLSTSPPMAEDVQLGKEKEKEKKGWGGLLWKAGGKKEGGD